MDLLNYQYLDKMNNNIGILCYEGKHITFCYFVDLETVLHVKLQQHNDIKHDI